MKEKYNERLLALRMIRKAPLLIAVIAAITVLGGGLYYLINVITAGPTVYEAKSYFLVRYEEEKTDYYINYYSWNTYIQSDEFARCFEKEAEGTGLPSADVCTAMMKADVESDTNIPDFIVSSEDPDEALRIALVTEKVMTGEFGDYLEGVDSIEILKTASVEPARRDVRTLRAFILSFVLGTFFTVVIFLLKELTPEGIHIPSTLRDRYGLKSLGYLESDQFGEAANSILNGSAEAVLITPGEDEDPAAIAKKMAEAAGIAEEKITPVPSPFIAGGVSGILKNAGSVIIAVRAGEKEGPKVERLLDYLKTYDIKPTAAFLYDTDVRLIRAYYRIGGNE